MKKLTALLAILGLIGLQVAFAQTRSIKGTVTSKEDGMGLPGANVQVKGTTTGTATDFDGNFTLNVPANAATLVISSIGYQTVEMPVQDVIAVTLEPESKKIDEVVVIGYGVVKKSELTGSVASVKPQELTDKPVSSISQALQGKVAGVQVVSTSGRTGDETQISVRGNGSLSASNSVLYIIDGVSQSTMGNISPNDVESMEVLKDAASTAIYGSRASNGVVLIQTKKGKLNSKTSVEVNSYYGVQEIMGRPDLLNAKEFKNIHDVARINFQNDIAAGILAAPADPAVLTPMADSPYDTDWLDLVLRSSSVVQNHQVSINGGTENTRVYLSGSFFQQDGVIKMDSYEKFRSRVNVDHKVSKYFKVGVQSYFSASESIPFEEDNNMYQPWAAAVQAQPNKSPYAADGTIGRYNFINPLWAFERKVTDKTQNLGATFFFDVTPIEGLVWHSSYSGNISNNRYNRFDAPNTKRGEDGAGVPTGYGYYSTYNNRDFQIENTLTYTGSILNKKLKYTILAGHSFQEWRLEDSYVQGENFPSNDLNWLVSAGTINKGRSYYTANALESYFTRFQFSWDEKYNLMISMRRDGSSKFADGNKWGAFPAVSAGWNVTKEEFFDFPVISNLKLRASLGYTGNQSGVSNTIGQNLIGSGYNHNGNPGLASPDLYNPDLHWETGQSINFGLDLGVFDNRATLTVDLYQKTTQDLLYRINVGQETGFSTMMSNDGGKISNKGIEIGTNIDIISQSNLKWSVSGNFSYNKNEVLELGNKNGFYTTGFASVVMKGESLGSFYMPEAIGIANEVYQYKNAAGTVTKTVQPGDMIYADLNGDGLINDKDRKVFSGGIAPIYGGLGTRVEYEGVDLSINTQYSLKKRVYAMYKESLLNGGNVGNPSFSDNMISDMNDYWTPTNKDAENPRPHLAASVSAWNLKRSSRFLEDADYLRITDITIGYNFKHVKIPFIQSIRVYAQARNPYTFTKYKGVDPEVQYVDPSSTTNKITAGVDSNGIPNIKSYVFGLNINF